MPVKVIGADTVASTMRSAAEDLADLAKAQRQAADLIAQTASALAPKRSGKLAASIQGEVITGTAVVGTPLVYAPVIHNGWPRHNIRPTPYLTDAADTTQDKWLGYYGDNVQAVCDKVRGV